MIHLRKLIVMVAAVSAASMIFIIYYNYDPSVCKWFPKCPSKLITGYDCPGCGTQRALHALFHGDVAGAFRFNAFMIPALLFVAVLWVASLLKKRLPDFHRAVTGNGAVYSVLAVIVVWTVVRNLPWFLDYCQ